MKYSLADYILSVESNDQDLQNIIGNVVIGGQGSLIGEVNAEHDNDLFQTESFPTGGWVHNKNLSKVGKVQVTISQLSEVIERFIRLCNIFFSNQEKYEGLTLSLVDSKSNNVFIANDCYITKIPQQKFGETADRQTWTFTCGEINFK